MPVLFAGNRLSSEHCRLPAVLHLIDLMARFAPCWQRKGTQVIERATAKLNRLGIHHAVNI